MGAYANAERTELGSLALRSFQIFGANWISLLRAFLAPTGLAFIGGGVAFLIISIVSEAQHPRGLAPVAPYMLPGFAPRPDNHMLWNVAALIIVALVEPLILTSLLLAIAVAAGEDVPYSPGFSTAVGVWPSQVQIVLAFFAPALGVWTVATWVWNRLVSVRGAYPFGQGVGLVLATACFVGAAALAFLGTLAAIPVALRDERPAAAILIAFDRVFLKSVFAGLSAAALFGLLLVGLPSLVDWLVAIAAVSTHFFPLMLLALVVPYVFTAVAATFAFLYARSEVATA